jgi:hypothetical protein
VTVIDQPSEDEVAHALDVLDAAVRGFQVADLDPLAPAEELALVGKLEVLRRRLDHGTDRAAEHLDRSARSASTATRVPRAR